MLTLPILYRDDIRKSNRGETERLAAKLEHDVMLRKRGLVDPEQEAARDKRNALIEDHIAAFKNSQQKNSGGYAKLVVMRVVAIIEEAALVRACDLDIDAVEQAILTLKKKKKLGHRTYNHYIQAINTFCNWMVTTKRIPTNPLVGIERLNAEVDVRHKRRALSESEMSLLVESARNSPKRIQSFPGWLRAQLYLFAYYTGLRRSELASLRRENLNLTSTPATVRIEAAHSKHRRVDVLPLHPELLAMLLEWFKELSPGMKLFPELEKKKAWFMVKKDLERVGIPYVTSERVADFHAAGRHTHITTLLKNGTSLVEARQLARHSDVRMTMKYTHIGLDDQARAVRNLPTPGVDREYFRSAP